MQKAKSNKSVGFIVCGIRFIQELLGHNDIKTALIYTEGSSKSIRKTISPLDNL